MGGLKKKKKGGTKAFLGYMWDICGSELVGRSQQHSTAPPPIPCWLSKGKLLKGEEGKCMYVCMYVGR